MDLIRLGQVLGLAALVYLLAAVSSWAQAYLMAGVAQRIVYRLRQAVEDKLARLPLRYFDSHPHGEILSRVTNDIDNVTTSLQDGLSQLLTSVLTVVGVLGVMFWISPLLAAVSLVTIPLAIVVTALIARRSKVQFVAQWSRTGRLNGLVEETYTGHALVLAFGQRRPMVEEFGRQNERLRDASFRAQFLSGVDPAGRRVHRQPQLRAHRGARRVPGGHRRDLAGQRAGAHPVLAAVPDADHRDRQPDEPAPVGPRVGRSGCSSSSTHRRSRHAGPPPAPPGRQRAGAAAARCSCSTCPSATTRTRPLIEDFTLEAAPGQTVAIVGPTGAGKTTVVNLLMRFYEIDGGRILLDGADYRDLSRDEVRRCFGMVLQDTWLFAGTIRDNIAYGRQAPATRRSSPRPGPPTSTTSSARCPTATPRFSTGTRPASPPARSSC